MAGCLTAGVDPGDGRLPASSRLLETVPAPRLQARASQGRPREALDLALERGQRLTVLRVATALGDPDAAAWPAGEPPPPLDRRRVGPS